MNKKKLLSMFATAALIVGCLAPASSANAATGDPTAISYVDAMYKNANAAASVGMKYDASLTYGAAAGQTDTMRVSGDFSSIIASQEYALIANVDWGLMGTALAMPKTTMQTYNIKNPNGGYDLYEFDGKTWEKEHVSDSDMESMGNAVTSDPMSLLSNLAVASTSQAISGKDCVVVSGELTGETIANIQKASDQESYKSYSKKIAGDKKRLQKLTKKQKKLTKKLKKTNSKKKRKKLKKNIKATKSQIKMYKKSIKFQKKQLDTMKKDDENGYAVLAQCSPVKYTFSIDKATNNPVKTDVDMTSFLKSYLPALDSEAKAYAESIQNCSISVTYTINEVTAINLPPEAQNAKSM